MAFRRSISWGVLSCNEGVGPRNSALGAVHKVAFMGPQTQMYIKCLKCVPDVKEKLGPVGCHREIAADHKPAVPHYPHAPTGGGVPIAES